MFRILRHPKSVIGFILSIIGLYYAFKDFSFNNFFSSLNDINYIYIMFASLLLWISIWFRGLRWKLLFSKTDSVTTSSLYRAEMIGNFGNNVFPLRLGELLRCYIVSQEHSLSNSFVIGTILLERMFDLIYLGLLSILLILIYPMDSMIRENILIIGTILILGVILLFIVLRYIKISTSNNKIKIAISNFIEGVLSLRRESFFGVIITSTIIWFIYFINTYLLQKAFQFNLNLDQILAVLVISYIAISIPSAPGMFGTFHLAVKKTVVEMFGITSSIANSFAILMHAYGYILLTVLGAYYLLRNQFHKNAINDVILSDYSNES